MIWLAERFGFKPWEWDDLDASTKAYWIEVIAIESNLRTLPQGKGRERKSG